MILQDLVIFWRISCWEASPELDAAAIMLHLEVVRLWWCAEFAISKHHLVWWPNIFGQRPNLHPGQGHLEFPTCLWVNSRWDFNRNLCSSPRELLLVKNQANSCCLYSLIHLSHWSVDLLQGLTRISSFLLWGQQLWADLNILHHLVEALTGLCGTSGEVEILWHRLTLTFQLSLWAAGSCLCLHFAVGTLTNQSLELQMQVILDNSHLRPAAALRWSPLHPSQCCHRPAGSLLTEPSHFNEEEYLCKHLFSLLIFHLMTLVYKKVFPLWEDLMY